LDLISIISYVISATAVVALALFDPKRNRVLRGRQSVQWLRRVLVVVLFAPGVLLMLPGRPATVLIWIGVASVVGWVAAWLVNLREQAYED